MDNRPTSRQVSYLCSEFIIFGYTKYISFNGSIRPAFALSVTPNAGFRLRGILLIHSASCLSPLPHSTSLFLSLLSTDCPPSARFQKVCAAHKRILGITKAHFSPAVISTVPSDLSRPFPRISSIAHLLGISSPRFPPDFANSSILSFTGPLGT